jgi:hypothetical protein
MTLPWLTDSEVDDLTAEVDDLKTKLATAESDSDEPVVEFSNSDSDTPPAEYTDEDDTDALAKRHWKKNVDLRDEYGGQFAAFKAQFARHPEDFADLK